MEKQLRATWCDILGVEESDINNDSNFFSEGGDSALALRLITAARDRNISLDTEAIYNNPNFVDMASVCHPLQPEYVNEVNPMVDGNVFQACAEACGVQKDLIEDIFPSTDTQHIVFHQHLESGALMLQTVFEICGALDLDLLHQTWQVLHDKNQILRTRLVKLGDQVLQVVVNDSIQWGSGYSLATYTATNKGIRVRSGDPLFRYAVVDEGDRRFFIWTCHHGGFDGWTRRLIMEKLQAGFNDIAKLKNERQGPTYRSFVDWKHSRSEQRVGAMTFWKQYLAAGYQNPEGVHCPSSGYVPLSSSHISRKLEMKMTSAKSFITASTFGHAAWALAIGSVWGLEDVLFATMKMGRQMPRDNPLYRVESIMGPLLTVVPVRLALHKDMRLSDFLQQVQDGLISTIQYEHEGWSAIVEYLGAEAILPGILNFHTFGSDIFSRSLQYKTPGYGAGYGYLKPRSDLSVNLTTNISLLLDIHDHEHYLDLRVSYDANIWEETLVTKLLDAFANMLNQLLSSRHCNVGELLSAEYAGTKSLKSRL